MSFTNLQLLLFTTDPASCALDEAEQELKPQKLQAAMWEQITQEQAWLSPGWEPQKWSTFLMAEALLRMPGA